METRMNKNDLMLFGIVALFLGALFDWLFYDARIGFNITLFVAVGIATGVYLGHRYDKPLGSQEILLLLPTGFFAAMISVRSSEFLTLLNMLAVFLLLLVVVRTYSNTPLREWIPEEYFRTIFLPFKFIKPFFDYCNDLFALRFVTAKNPQTRELVRGVILATLGIIFFSSLLASADMLFARTFNALFSFIFDGKFIEHVVRIGFVTAFFIGVFGYVYGEAYADDGPISHARHKRSFGALESSIFLGAISVLFGIFIILQVSYLFGGQLYFASQGITYAEYARKGFFELIAVALFSYLMISIAERQIVKKERENTHLNSFKLLSGIIVVEVVLMLVSASTRLSLYESAYGFSTVRLYSHAFIVWIGVMLVLLAHHIFANGSRTSFALRGFISMIVFVFVMNMLNPDAFIAQHNLERYAATGKIDTRYLASLSDDAIPYTVDLLRDPHPEVRSQFAIDLQEVRNRRTPTENAWKSFTFSRLYADSFLAAYVTISSTGEPYLQVDGE